MLATYYKRVKKAKRQTMLDQKRDEKENTAVERTKKNN